MFQGCRSSQNRASRQKLLADGADDDHDVHAQRPPLDVIEIVIDPRNRRAGLGRTSPAAADLREPGNARPRRMALKVVWHEVFVRQFRRQHSRNMRSRPDQRHVALDHVEQLRNFVEAGLAQNPPDRRHARIALNRLPYAALVAGIVAHGAELVDLEAAVSIPVPVLKEQHRARRRRLYRDRNRRSGEARKTAARRLPRRYRRRALRSTTTAQSARPGANAGGLCTHDAHCRRQTRQDGPISGVRSLQNRRDIVPIEVGCHDRGHDSPLSWNRTATEDAGIARHRA